MVKRSECMCSCHRNPRIKHAVACCVDDGIEERAKKLADYLNDPEPSPAWLIELHFPGAAIRYWERMDKDGKFSLSFHWTEDVNKVKRFRSEQCAVDMILPDMNWTTRQGWRLFAAEHEWVKPITTNNGEGGGNEDG